MGTPRTMMTQEKLAAIHRVPCIECGAPRHHGCISRYLGRVMVHQVHSERLRRKWRKDGQDMIGKDGK